MFVAFVHCRVWKRKGRWVICPTAWLRRKVSSCLKWLFSQMKWDKIHSFTGELQMVRKMARAMDLQVVDWESRAKASEGECLSKVCVLALCGFCAKCAYGNENLPLVCLSVYGILNECSLRLCVVVGLEM